MSTKGNIIKKSELVLKGGIVENAEMLSGYRHTDFIKTEHATLVGVGGHIPSGGTTSQFLRGDGTWVTVAVTDTNNYLTSVTGVGDGTLTFKRNGLADLTVSLAHTHTFTSLTSKPTTISGFGITDAFTKVQVQDEIAKVVGSSPSTLDTLVELADALGRDPNFATTMTNLIGTKANSSVTLSGGTGITTTIGDLSANRTISVDSTVVRTGTKTNDYVWLQRNSTGAVLLLTQQSTGPIMEFRQGAGDGSLKSTISNDGSFSGNSASASKWLTARTLTLSGAVTGAVSMDGSGNVTLATAVNHNHDSDYLKLSGGAITGDITLDGDVTLTKSLGKLNLNNTDITGINKLVITDPGVNEGIEWAGGNLWKIYESPDNLTNASGNLQFVQNSTRRMTIKTDGTVNIVGALTTPSVYVQNSSGVSKFQISYNASENSLDFNYI